MIIKHSTEILQAKASKGNIKYWQGHICCDDDTWYTQTSFWQETKEGKSKVQFTNPKLIKGKNQGRANATTDEQQAYSELESTFKKQVDKGYHKEGEAPTILQQCMLASQWQDDKHKYVGKRLCVQRKYDGNRCLSDGTKMWSRKGKVFIQQCIRHLLFDTKGYIIDGELILPSKYGFQKTNSAIKRFRIDLTPFLEYHVYDIADPTKKLTFDERYNILTELVKNAPVGVKLVKTIPIDSFDDVKTFHDQFVREGFEGVIVRWRDGIYKPNTKSSSPIMKYKEFLDEEFEIIDVFCGAGQHEGAIMFKCKTLEGKVFDCGIVGSIDKRREMYENGENYIGKMLNVRFQPYSKDQKYSDDGLPRFPTGRRVRDYDLEGGDEELSDVKESN